MKATQAEIARFMSFVDKLPNGCWYWTGARSRGKGNRKWYGSFHFRGKTIRAHRFSCDYIGGFKPLPSGQHRSHSCDFSMCVCPAHLVHSMPEINPNIRQPDAGTNGVEIMGHRVTQSTGVISQADADAQTEAVKQIMAEQKLDFGPAYDVYIAREIARNQRDSPVNPL